MREFSKPVRRAVRIKSTDPSIPSAVWIVTMDERGVQFRRKGEQGVRRLTWRAVLGYGLVHLRASGD
jgi:hypothetical protein